MAVLKRTITDKFSEKGYYDLETKELISTQKNKENQRTNIVELLDGLGKQGVEFEIAITVKDELEKDEITFEEVE
jgi:hypothetical protein